MLRQSIWDMLWRCIHMRADVVGMLLSATEPYSLYPPCCTATCNRDVIGIVTKIHDERADVERASRWLKLAGCKNIFYVDSKCYEGIPEILEYLKEDGDVLPWEEEAKTNKTKH